VTDLFQYGKKAAGGVEHVPPGWDEWHGLVSHIECSFAVCVLKLYNQNSV